MEENELIAPSYVEWLDAANTATDSLYECVKNEAEDRFIRLYEVLSIASSLCAVAAAIKERK